MWSDEEWLRFYGNGYLWFSILAAASGALALGATVGLSRYGDRIRKAQEEQIRTAHSRTLQLEVELEQARVRHAELQAAVQPRDLTADQQHELTEICRAFSGRSVDLDVNRLDLEGFLLGQLIKESLEQAEIQVVHDLKKPPTIDGFGSGVLVYPARKNDELAKSLASALSRFGLVVNDPQPEEMAPNSRTRISIGVRPFLAENNPDPGKK